MSAIGNPHLAEMGKPHRFTNGAKPGPGRKPKNRWLEDELDKAIKAQRPVKQADGTVVMRKASEILAFNIIKLATEGNATALNLVSKLYTRAQLDQALLDVGRQQITVVYVDGDRPGSEVESIGGGNGNGQTLELPPASVEVTKVAEPVMDTLTVAAGGNGNGNGNGSGWEVHDG